MARSLKINFVGTFNQLSLHGEFSDETHITWELEKLGHTVQRVPRDVWKAVVEGGSDPSWNDKLPIEAGINIICKWHHFNGSKFISKLRERGHSPVFYWVWDWMDGWPHAHKELVEAADLYIANDVYHPQYQGMKNCYYFPFDASSKEFDRIGGDLPKIHDVAFFGSYLQQGDRIEWLKKINEKFKVAIYAHNYQEWEKEGFKAYPAVFGNDFAMKVAQTRITLGFNVNDHTYGYWSNRVGKTLTVGGFLLQRYVPGMELSLRDGVAYFSSPEEAIESIGYYLLHEDERQKIADRGYQLGRQYFTSQQRAKELGILIERYLEGAFHA